MLLADSYGRFGEQPKDEAGQSLPCLSCSFVAEIIESLLHGLAHLLPECSRIKREEFLVEGANCFLVIRHT